jgi:AAHS family 4-hydroxybenzoate transporter-like MFS transporter
LQGENVETRQVNFHEIIDSSAIGGRQYVILAFCSLLMLFDGFNTHVISFIAPVMAKQWHWLKDAFGPIFSAVFFGLLIGHFGVAFITQRVGTKKTTIIAAGAFRLFTLLAASASNLAEQIVLRVLAGIGLGAATTLRCQPGLRVQPQANSCPV